MTAIKTYVSMNRLKLALECLGDGDDDDSDFEEADEVENISLFASHTDMIFSRELEDAIAQAKKAQKIKDKCDHAVDESKLYPLNDKNQIGNKVPLIVDRWDILDQLHRYYKTQTDLSVIKSAHIFGLFIQSMNCARDLAHLEQLVAQLPLLPYLNLPCVDSYLMLQSSSSDDRPGIRVPHAQGFNITDWNIVENADGTNLFLARKRMQTTDINPLRADVLLNVQFEVQGLADLDVQATFYTKLHHKQLKFQQQGTQLVCKLEQPVWNHRPLMAAIHLELGLTLPRGQFPPPIFMICRQERVFLKFNCSKLLGKCLKRFSIHKKEGIIEIGFRKEKVKSAETVRVRRVFDD